MLNRIQSTASWPISKKKYFSFIRNKKTKCKRKNNSSQQIKINGLTNEKKLSDARIRHPKENYIYIPSGQKCFTITFSLD